MAKTSYSDGHIHTWSKTRKYTSSDKGVLSGMHRHKINLKGKIAMDSGSGHKHILFGSMK